MKMKVGIHLQSTTENIVALSVEVIVGWAKGEAYSLRMNRVQLEQTGE